jgi:hypothetical protein
VSRLKLVPDPLTIRIDRVKLEIDLGAEKVFAAEKNGQKIAIEDKRPRRKQRGIVTLFLTFHAPQGAGNLPVILLKVLLILLLLTISIMPSVNF